MNEYGRLVEEVSPFLGPIKRRSLREEWLNDQRQVTAIVPLTSTLTLVGEIGWQKLCDLGVRAGRVERLEARPW